MSAKPTKRNWNDVQTAIATAAIVTTLGMWNLFATPAETVTARAEDSTIPPTEPPAEPSAEPTASPEPTALPYVKVMFTPNAPLPTITAPQQQVQTTVDQKKKKREKRKSNGGGGSTVTQTQSS
ncbi:MAG TPA: hypothetical protein VHP14_25285 [Anaerolineales bacterium]|nr:hypothetical protein [Anaerolineales bacterium]